MTKPPVKFLDNPTSRTVVAVFEDDSKMVLTDISGDNYTNPPGWGMTRHQLANNKETLRIELHERTKTYRITANKQMKLT